MSTGARRERVRTAVRLQRTLASTHLLERNKARDEHASCGDGANKD